MADLLTRPLSVKFSTNNLRGISHNDVLQQNECIITLTSTKNKLILGTTNIKNRVISIHDVENLITNVTVKDSPYEWPDSIITAHMSKYDDIGQFTIRIFADNNRTTCRHCGDTSHPYFRCKNIPEKTNTRNISCGNCHGNHQRRECHRDVLCCFCGGEEGHVQMRCPRKLFGNYMADIIEGRDILESEKSDSSSEDGFAHQRCQTPTPAGMVTPYQIVDLRTTTAPQTPQLQTTSSRQHRKCARQRVTQTPSPAAIEDGNAPPPATYYQKTVSRRSLAKPEVSALTHIS
ncbi:hypothetical protein MAR_035680 [Mya arenaria]|uniref:CCHC-type domain-containing protein n=1 Tax=Mya arenaria TaxID=6604 RepID=A0ABY7ENF5_MYAAR|nr:hypothetical protein MAR_035680 [Mya arenaria]